MLLAAAGAAVIGMFAVAAIDDLTRPARFLLLSGIGATALVGWPGTALAQPFSERRPLRLRHGKPPVAAEPMEAPAGGDPDAIPATYSLSTWPTWGALIGALLAATVAGVIGFALAAGDFNDGGLSFFIVFSGAVAIAGRSVFRLMTGGSAVTLESDQVTLGPALGYVPPLTLERSSVERFGLDAGPQPQLTLVADGGRRFEIRPDHLQTDGLVRTLAAAWPEVGWSRPSGD